MVDLPEAERPVSQIVRPRWLRSSLRSLRVRALAWKVMFLLVTMLVDCGMEGYMHGGEGEGSMDLRRHC